MRSVTQIIKEAGLMPTGPWFSQVALDRGTAVHLACQYLCEGRLNWSSVHHSILHRVQQFQRFLDEMQPEILAVEEEVTSDLGYVGHLDLRIRLNGHEGIMDIKPNAADWHGIQLAAYAGCFDRHLHRWGLILNERNPLYRVHPYTDRNDWRVFKSALTTVRWKEEHGLCRMEESVSRRRP